MKLLRLKFQVHMITVCGILHGILLDIFSAGVIILLRISPMVLLVVIGFRFERWFLTWSTQDYLSCEQVVGLIGF